MFLAVVAAPILEHGFDGKIFVDRVSSWKPYEKSTCNQRFTDDAQLNGQLRGGQWLELLVDDMTLEEFKEAMTLNYFLDEAIVERLVIRHYGPPGNDGKPKAKYIVADNHVLPTADCMRSGYTLMVRYQGETKTKDGDLHEVDINCNSDYMSEVMPKVGKVGAFASLTVVASPARLIVVSFSTGNP